MRNNRGQTITIAILIMAVIIAFGIVLSFVFSEKLRLTIIGIGIIVGSLVIFVKGANTPSAGKRTFGFALIVLLVGVFIMMLPIFGISGQQVLGGQTTWSIDTITIEGQDKIVITASVGSGADTMIIDFTKDDLNNQLADQGFAVNQGVNGIITLQEFDKVFDLQRQAGEAFFQPSGSTNTGNIPASWVALFLGGFAPSFQAGIDECASRSVEAVNWYIDDPGFFGIDDLICISEVAFADRSIITGTGEVQFDIEVSIAGDSETMTENNQQVTLAGGDFFVEFIGSLSAPPFVESPNFDVLFENSQFKHLISTQSINFVGGSGPPAFNGPLNDFMNPCVINNGGTRNGLPPDQGIWESCIFGYFDEIDEVLENKNNVYLSSSPSVRNLEFQTEGSNQGQLRIGTVPTEIPVLRMVIEADAVGLHILQGDPEIQKVGGKCFAPLTFDSGIVKSGTISLKNVGNEAGMFEFSSDCVGGSIVGANPLNPFIDAGDTEDIEVAVTGTASENAVSGSCTITFTSSTPVGGESSDQCSFDFNIAISETLCNPGHFDCSDDANQILECSDDGTEWTVSETCEDNLFCSYVLEDNEYQCVSEGIIFGTGGSGEEGETTVLGDDTPTIATERAECEQKAEDIPIMGWTFIKSTEEKCSFFCRLGITNPVEVETSQCVAKNIPIFVIGGFMALILIVAMFFLFSKKKVKRRRRKRR